MHIPIQLGEVSAEFDDGALDALTEHVIDQGDWQHMLLNSSNVSADIANDNRDIWDEVSDIVTSQDWYHDWKSRLEDLEGNNSLVSQWFEDNKHDQVEALLNDYSPGRSCSTGHAFTNAVKAAVQHLEATHELHDVAHESAPNSTVTELAQKVEQLEETIASLLQALSLTGRLAGEQFGLAMFSEASKRATEASREAFQNEIADENRRASLDAIFEALGGEV